MWHENVAWKRAIGQVCPLYKQNVRKSNGYDQTLSHRLSALYKLVQKEHIQTSWKEFIAKNRNWVLKSEIDLLYPRWPLPAAVRSIPHVRTSRKVGWWVGFTKHTSSDAATLAVVLISKICKGVAALLAFQKLTPLVEQRRCGSSHFIDM